MKALKLCSCCHERKPLSEFRRGAHTKTGRVSRCKRCDAKRRLRVALGMFSSQGGDAEREAALRLPDLFPRSSFDSNIPLEHRVAIGML